MEYFKLLIVLLILGSCKNYKQKDNFVISEYDSTSTKTISGKDIVNCEEYLDYDNLVINGKLKYENRINELILYAGAPDSIVKKEDVLSLYNDSIYEIYYYKSYDFIVYNKLAFLDRVKYRNNNVQLSFPLITFNENTRKEDIKKIFPCTFENNIDTLTLKKETTERIFFLMKPDFTCHWNIFYKENKLVEIEFKDPG